MPVGFDWVDAFSDAPFAGNGCAVFHDAADLPDEVCTAIVRETSLTECTFLGPSEVADLRVRFFLASQEIPFAGHPTIATVASLVDRGMVAGDALTLETGAGVIPVEISEAGGGAPVITMTQPAPRFGREISGDVLAEAGGIAAGDILGMPQIVSTGAPFCITVLRDMGALAALRLDTEGLARFRAATGAEAGEFVEPFWVVREGATGAGDTFARLLLAPPNPPEDAFTGSATGAMAAYLWAHGMIGQASFVAEQGHGMGRPGRATVEVLGPPDAVEGVRVGGQGYVLMRGFLNIG